MPAHRSSPVREPERSYGGICSREHQSADWRVHISSHSRAAGAHAGGAAERRGSAGGGQQAPFGDGDVAWERTPAPANFATARCKIGVCIVIVPVGSYELVPSSHPFVGGLAARSQCRDSGLAGDGAELCRLRAFQTELRQNAGRGVYPVRESLTGSLSRSPHGIPCCHGGEKIERIDRKRSLVRGAQARRRGDIETAAESLLRDETEAPRLAARA